MFITFFFAFSVRCDKGGGEKGKNTKGRVCRVDTLWCQNPSPLLGMQKVQPRNR